MRIIKNSHAGVGGIATESMEMLQYFHRNKNHYLSLIHRDVNHEKYFKIDSQNTSTHYLLVTRNVSDLTVEADNLKDFYKKHSDKIKSMEDIMDEEQPEAVFCTGTFYYPWFLLKAAQNKNLPIFIRYAGVIEKEEEEPIWHEMGKDFINDDYTYIFPSEHTKNTVEKIHQTKLKETFIVPNGIKDAYLKHKRKIKLDDKFRIAYVGRLAKVKNPSYMLTLSDILKKSNIQNELICVTDTSELSKASKKTKKIVQDMHEKNIKILPAKNAYELAEFYNSVDLVVTPSHFETFGMVPFESIAVGTPAMINHTVGAKEVYNSLGIEDLVVDFNDHEEVIKKIKLIKDYKFTIPDWIRREVREEYSWDSIIRKYVNIIEDKMLGKGNIDNNKVINLDLSS